MSASAERNLTTIGGAGATGSRSSNSQPSHHNVVGVPSSAAAAVAAFHPHLRLVTDVPNPTPVAHHVGTAGAGSLVNANTPLTAAFSYLRPQASHPQMHQRHGGFLPTAGSSSSIPGSLTASGGGTRDGGASGPGTAAVIKSPVTGSSVTAATAGGGRDNRMEFYPHLAVGFGGGNVGVSGNHLPSPAAAAAAVAAAAAYLGAGGQSGPSLSTIVPPTAHQQSAAAPASNQQNSGGTSFTPYHRLKVEDALSYLDQVKMQFGNKQHIYNDFLDIMKDFKSQAIDTPGVIQRVSKLFRGHPNLIVGFNTFLPPGYKIEVHGEAGERVSICTPSGQSHLIAAEGPFQSDSPAIGTSRPLAAVSSGLAPGDARGAAGVSHLSNGPAGNKMSGVPPLEFNHAINYVNKIKTRFQNQPEVYKQFLEILHTYQKEQRDLKEGVWPPGQRPLTEAEVYSMVARLFANEDDLLREFGQFLPDASAASAQAHVQQLHSQQNQQSQQQQQHPSAGLMASVAQVSAAASQAGPSPAQGVTHLSPIPPSTARPAPTVTSARLVSPPPVAKAQNVMPEITAPATPPRSQTGSSGESVKRRSRSPSPSYAVPSSKKLRATCSLTYDISASEAARFGTLSEYQFFDKVRKALKEDEVYDNFLRCLVLYNQELVSKSEVIQLIQPFLGKFPELLKWLREFLGCNEVSGYVDAISSKTGGQERISYDLALDVDYASCKRFGVSYRALPASYVHPKSSGRTALCDEVLNDTWVSFPSWQSEDSFVSSKKTQYEEFVYRTEDERFELDIVIETNKNTIQVLENVQAKLSQMPQEEAKRFRLDNALGGTSQVLHQRAVKRIYGDKAGDIIDGLKRNPLVAVPLVLKRMKTKDEEWREAQKGFNRIWREQNEKYYWKSLDHQGLNFKQNDLKAIRSKALINQIETLYDERHELIEEGATPVPVGPHMEIMYSEERSVFYDVNDLLIHHVKRQSMHKEEKSKIKKTLKVVLPCLFGLDALELSDDEDGGDDDADDPDSMDGDAWVGQQNDQQRKGDNGSSAGIKTELDGVTANPLSSKRTPHCSRLMARRASGKSSCGYSLMYFPNPCFVFLRLHQLLCERLGKLRWHANQMIAEQTAITTEREEISAAESLRCRPKAPCSPTEYYPMLLQLIKNVLDGQIDSTQFEDSLRDMFTINAYLAFTMDRMIQTMVKQLQAMVNEDLCVRSMSVYEKWSTAGGAGGFAFDSVNRRDNEEAYQREAEQLMLDQNCFKAYFFHEDCRVTFELLNTDSDTDESPETVEKSNRWTLYVQEYIASLSNASNADLIPEQFLEALAAKPVFLNRSVCRVKKGFGDASRKPSSSHGSTTGDAGSSVSVGIVGSKECVEQPQPSTSGLEEASSDWPSPAVLMSRAMKDVQMSENLQAHCNNNNTTRFRYVAGSGDYFYRTGSIQRARNCRLKVTEARNRRFASLQERWMLANVSMDQARITGDWFMGRAENMQLASVWMQRISEVCPTRPPSFSINKYLVDKSQNPATFGLSQPSTPSIGVTAPFASSSSSTNSR